MKIEIFEIETAEGFAQFKGVTFGQLWNGWECPLFTLDVVKDILAGLGTEDEAKNCSFSFYEYDSFYDVIIERVWWGGKIEAVDTSKPILIDGVKYYSVASFCWTWSKA